MNRGIFAANFRRLIVGFGVCVWLAALCSATRATLLFVSDIGVGSTTGKIYQVTPPGVVSVFAENQTYPYGLVFDSHGNLFVANDGDNEIDKFSPTGAKTVFASGLGNPSG